MALARAFSVLTAPACPSRAVVAAGMLSAEVDDGCRGRAAAGAVELLGPLRLVVDGMAVDVRGPKRRAVLALLALAEGRAVTVDHLVDALWPSEVPESGRAALHSHVFRLRAHLGPAAARLQTLHDGYRLVLGTGDLDVSQARALLATVRTGSHLLPRRPAPIGSTVRSTCSAEAAPAPTPDTGRSARPSSGPTSC